ncbi:hypothetical protein RCH18_001464 [Flavobacterium sp. PL11]|uniref:HYC_CC_PP family protein n=1 Tax=Flavobacterium sp. PL11 TaxID=3071717 RepID=UPI002DFA0BAF|nr:hypothetical protein [Flavobacterium sp. PL11]
MNFKKCTSLFLAFLLLVSSAGLAFNVHYCGEQIASVSLKTATFQKVEKACCVKSALKEENCCKDKVVNFQKKSDNTVLKVFSIDYPYYVFDQHVQTVVFTLKKNVRSTKNNAYFCETNAPPLFKLYSQYVFYA